MDTNILTLLIPVTASELKARREQIIHDNIATNIATTRIKIEEFILNKNGTTLCFIHINNIPDNIIKNWIVQLTQQGYHIKICSYALDKTMTISTDEIKLNLLKEGLDETIFLPYSNIT